MSEKKDQEYFADGMAEEIQNILAILVLQDEIATAIARALRVTVSARDARAW
jgi:TolB-like protein